MSQYPKRLIEVDLPIKRISVHARREKSAREASLSSLHIWWARRPLAACRAVICAALWPDPAPNKDDAPCPPSFLEAARREMLVWTSHKRQHLLSTESRQRFEAARQKPSLFDKAEELRKALLDFIADFADCNNSSVREYVDTSRALTRAAHESLGGAPGTKPLVVDPFAGGGSIPLEALRIGADAFASDFNPIAVLLNKVALEYIPRFGQRLVDEVRKWGEWIKREAEKELTHFYPKDLDGATPIAYHWARTIRCEAPGCGVEVPILLKPTLCDKPGREAAVAIRYPGKRLETVVVHGEEAKKYQVGTNRRSSATCPLCGYTTPRKSVEKQASTSGFGYHLLAVCLRRQGKTRYYRQPSDRDLRLIEDAEEALRGLENKTVESLAVIPREELPYLRSIFNVRVYAIA